MVTQLYDVWRAFTLVERRMTIVVSRKLTGFLEFVRHD
jgi:hypothetical protein